MKAISSLMYKLNYFYIIKLWYIPFTLPVPVHNRINEEFHWNPMWNFLNMFIFSVCEWDSISTEMKTTVGVTFRYRVLSWFYWLFARVSLRILPIVSKQIPYGVPHYPSKLIQIWNNTLYGLALVFRSYHMGGRRKTKKNLITYCTTTFWSTCIYSHQERLRDNYQKGCCSKWWLSISMSSRHFPVVQFYLFFSCSCYKLKGMNEKNNFI